MANDKVKVATSKLTALADAIRAKSGGSEEITLNDIPSITTEIVNELTHLTFTLPPKEYTAGDALDLTGMSVIAHYSHLGDKDVTSVATISPAGGSPLVTGNNTITASYTEKGVTKTASVVVNAKAAVATWADGTWAEIADALNKHKNGEVNLYATPGWEIGATKLVPLSLMAAGIGGGNFPAQNVEFVLMDKNAVDLAAGGKCNFVIGMKDCLAGGTTTESGGMNPEGASAYGWANSARRAWCNSTFVNAVPAGLKSLVKNASIKTSAGNASTTINTTTDTWFFPCEYNVFGSIKYSVSGEDTVQWEWYKTSNNRYKSMNGWWERSPTNSFGRNFCQVRNGKANFDQENYNRGLSLHACI